MLDPHILRSRPKDVSDMLQARNVDFDLDALLDADERRRYFMQLADDMRQERNFAGRQVAQFKRDGVDTTAAIKEMKDLSEKLYQAEGEQQSAESEYLELAWTIPNMIDKSVPRGPDETANVVLRKWVGTPTPSVPKGHEELAVGRGLLDMKRAAKVSGARFYYLKGSLVRLNQALISHSLDFLGSRGYTLVQPPYLIRRNAMEGAIIAEDFEDVIYKIEDDDLYLIGTSEHAMAAMHSDEIIEGGLPLRYAGVSPCFRKEAGAHGKDQKGIFRVHQFDKIEQFVFSKPEDSWREHDRMLEITEEFYQGLGIPYRVVLLSSGDMGKVSAKTYDIECWMAAQDAYREVVSCSNCLDFQSRRLKVRFRDRTDEDTQYVHTLNSTLAATSRLLACIIENFQEADGTIRVPQPLQKYVGKEAI
ncbi:seryl-tRNA synthetase [Cenarchaeum symbiosum A]|uniref:Serine--tRNA ligase n=1 Tax=Cenarchaeum symbiosum (strain A) TaxID=414004 RepID=SYS_CENSY|nr:RecName: Full=Serine--tRNA ligase; AltName: Full=Seryl-tRNA synthetase; Short=SerRS; AltName: Full=Seryl-tRNA(Ser/Sec) synthetase [Cenarchaeum symbiosum A]ABK76745.1 seryl-tRNA synthetase [Cenarchaeum symbiosum A]